MTTYRLFYRNSGLVTQFESESDKHAARLILSSRNHTEPADLWRDDVYITSLQRSDDGGFWRLYRNEHFVVDGQACEATIGEVAEAPAEAVTEHPA